MKRVHYLYSNFVYKLCDRHDKPATSLCGKSLGKSPMRRLADHAAPTGPSCLGRGACASQQEWRASTGTAVHLGIRANDCCDVRSWLRRNGAQAHAGETTANRLDASRKWRGQVALETAKMGPSGKVGCGASADQRRAFSQKGEKKSARPNGAAVRRLVWGRGPWSLDVGALLKPPGTAPAMRVWPADRLSCLRTPLRP